MSLRDKILGRPLASSEEGKEKLSVITGVPVLGLDALASAGYGPEAALTILVAAGIAGVRYKTKPGAAHRRNRSGSGRAALVRVSSPQSSQCQIASPASVQRYVILSSSSGHRGVWRFSRSRFL